MTFGFKIGLELSSRHTLPIDESVLISQLNETTVYLIKVKKEGPIDGLINFSLCGTGYSSFVEAAQNGEVWRDRLSFAFAKLRIGFDFGRWKPVAGGLTDEVTRLISDQTGQKVVNDHPGVLVFEEPSPLTFSMFANGTVAISQTQMTEAFDAAATLENFTVTDKERLAFDLYGASFFQGHPESRLLILTMAIEALAEPVLRSDEAVNVVVDLKRRISTSGLPPAEISSILGAMRHLEKESISRACRRLISTLSDEYGGLTPTKLFTKAYEVRSDLVHGNDPRPTGSQVNELAPHLQTLVGDLLMSRLLRFPRD